MSSSRVSCESWSTSMKSSGCWGPPCVTFECTLTWVESPSVAGPAALALLSAALRHFARLVFQSLSAESKGEL